MFRLCARLSSSIHSSSRQRQGHRISPLRSEPSKGVSSLHPTHSCRPRRHRTKLQHPPSGLFFRLQTTDDEDTLFMMAGRPAGQPVSLPPTLCILALYLHAAPQAPTGDSLSLSDDWSSPRGSRLWSIHLPGGAKLHCRPPPVRSTCTVTNFTTQYIQYARFCCAIY